MLKKLALVGVTGLMSVGLTACNDREVATGTAIVGSAIVAGAVADDYYNRDYRYSRGYYNNYYYYNGGSRRYYRDRGGRWSRGPRRAEWGGRHNGGGRGSWGGRDGGGHHRGGGFGGGRGHGGRGGGRGHFESFAVNMERANTNATAALAAKYHLSNASADQVVKAFENVKRYGKLDSLQNIGMSDADVANITAGKQPSKNSISNIARQLNADRAAVVALVQDVSDEFSIRSQLGWDVE